MIRSLLLLSLVLSLLPAVVVGQEVSTSAPTTDEATHDAIRELRDSLINSVNSKDVILLTSLLHEDVILTAQAGDELVTIRSRDGVGDYIDRLLTGPNAGVKQMTVNPVVDELTILHGDDTGIAYGHSSDDYTLRDGSQFTLKTHWSATIVKDDASNWQLANLHVSSNLFDNPVLDAVKGYVLLAGIAAGLCGLLLGYIGARFIGRTITKTPVLHEPR